MNNTIEYIVSAGICLVLFGAGLYIGNHKPSAQNEPSVLMCTSSGVLTTELPSDNITYHDGAFWLISPSGKLVPYVKNMDESCLVIPEDELKKAIEQAVPKKRVDPSTRNTMLMPI